MKTLETATTTTEVEAIVNQLFADCGITGHENESYAETADRIEKEVSEKYGAGDASMADVVEFLRKADARWFELEA